MKTSFFTSALLASCVAAAPTPVEVEVEARAAPSFAPIRDSNQLKKIIDALYTDVQYLGLGAVAVAALFNAIVPINSPNSFEELAEDFKKITDANPRDILEYGAQIILNGFAGSDYLNLINSYLFLSNTNNINLRNPSTPIYPKASAEDAPYELSEAALRKPIHIPADFQYGKLPIVIFLPGTATVSGQSFGPNIGKLLKQQKVADPVYLNLPGTNLADIQVAAEYVAYAIGYISGISNGAKVSTISWSAGSVDSQWAFKYWPSIRSKTANAIRYSADLHGTVLARLLCPGSTTPFCTPAIAQQLYNSTFIATLRNNGGDQAYVPTTSMYSIFDEIVQPQSDPIASAAIGDARGVGSTNVELQGQCTALLPGGLPLNDHEGVLFNALAYSLAVDAIKNNGPGQLNRVNVAEQCERFAADGLSLPDIFATYATIPIAALNILAFTPKSEGEPPIKAYAVKDIPAGY